VTGPKRVPATTETARGDHFRRLLKSRAGFWAMVLLALATFIAGATTGNPAIAFAAPPAAVLLVIAILFAIADRAAENEFFKLFAAGRGWSWSKEWTVTGYTPLLAAGDRRKCRHWMQGPVGGHMDGECSMGWYTFEVRQDNGDKPDTWTPYHFTVCVMDMEAGMTRFPGVFLRRRRGLFERLNTDSNWLSGRDCRKLELESTAFIERYDLFTDPDVDENAVRQLFGPKFILWLAEHPICPNFEYRSGTLVVYLFDHVGEAGKLEWLLSASREILERIRRETFEAVNPDRPVRPVGP
jgi:hypothetical protein